MSQGKLWIARRSAVVVAGILVTLGLATPVHATARPHVGGACKIKGKQVARAEVRLQCVKRQGRLVWVRVAPAASPKATDTLTGELIVFAAASLTEAFGALERQFEALHPRARITMSFGASSALATQIIAGAPADVFASASTKNMQQVLDAGVAATAVTFARNRMMLVMPRSNPAHITSLQDLSRPGIRFAMCQIQVPCGAVSSQVLMNAGVATQPVTFEVDVKSVLTKVVLGEVDAGLVYVTDARSAAADVASVSIPQSTNAETVYPIAAMRASTNGLLAQEFIAYVLGERGAAALAAVGFTVL